MESEELFLHGLPTYSPACLRLTNVLMERIIRLLPTQADRYEACLIHRVWTTAAMGILWESPRFSSPNSVRHFLNTIRKNKQLALTVRKLDLVLSITAEHDDAFKESMRMTLGRHVPYQDKPLAVPQVIQAVVQQCERLDGLSIYGWQLEEIHLRLIAAYLPHLQTLRIIGSRTNRPVILPPMAASTLRKLHLYADFIVQPTRFTELVSLRVSLHQESSFDKLCNNSSTFPKVRELMLANATLLKNEHFDAIFSVFPQLVNFALEDISNSIDASRLIQSSTVKHFILRPTDDMNFLPPSEDATPSPAHLSTVLLDTCRMGDAYFGQLVFHLDSLTSVSLYDCPSLTDAAMVRLCEKNAPLEELHIIRCPQIGNQTVCALNHSYVVRTLCRLHIESSGPLRPEDVYGLISSAVPYSLECVDIGGYPNIRDAFFGKPSSGKRVVLDKNGIRSVVKQGIAPKERHLTSYQITCLAKALNMDVWQLETLLDQVQLDKSDGISVATETPTTENCSRNSTSSNLSTISLQDSDRPTVTENGHGWGHEQQQQRPPSQQQQRSLSQQQQQRPPSQQQPQRPPSQQQQRPPSQQLQQQRQPSQQQKQPASQQQQRPPQQQQQQELEVGQQNLISRQQQNRQIQNVQTVHQQQQEQQQEQQLEAEQQSLIPRQQQNRQIQNVQTVHQQQQTSHGELIQAYRLENGSDYEAPETITISLAQNNRQLNSFESEGGNEYDDQQFGNQEDLGGWGMTGDLSWLQSAEHSSGDNTSTESGRPSKHSYEHAWRQIARESPVVTAQSRLARDQKLQDFADGWGTPRNIVEWSDDRLGYAHDVLEKQKRTTFWSQSDNGEWVSLSDAPAPTSTAPANKAPGNNLRSFKSESTTGRPSSRSPAMSRKKSFGSDTLRRPSAGPSRSTSSRVPRTESANVDKWAAFSANEMQQFKDAKKRKPTAQEVEELDVPDLINLDSKDDDMIPLGPTTSSSPLKMEPSTIKPEATKSTPHWA